MLVSEDVWRSNILNGLKDCPNLHSRAFNIFIDQYERNVVGKSLSYWYAKFRLFVNTLTVDDK